MPGYSDEMKPEFYSTGSSSRVVLKNVNYTQEERRKTTGHNTGQVTGQYSIGKLVDLCETARTREEIQSFVGIANRAHFRKAYLYPLLESGQLKMTMPDKPRSKKQKYIKRRQIKLNRFCRHWRQN